MPEYLEMLKGKEMAISVTLIPKKYIGWRLRFDSFVCNQRTVQGPSVNNNAVQEDWVSLNARSFHLLLGSLVQHSCENIRLFHEYADALEAFVTKADGYFRYAGENALDEDRATLNHVLTILMYQGLLKPNEDIWESELIVPPHSSSKPFIKYLLTVSDVEQYLLSLCAYFRSNIVVNKTEN